MEKKKLTDGTFLRDAYLRCENPIDINLVTEEHSINPSDYTIKKSVFSELLEEYEVKDGTDDIVAVTFLMLMSGPKLIEG